MEQSAGSVGGLGQSKERCPGSWEVLRSPGGFYQVLVLGERKEGVEGKESLGLNKSRADSDVAANKCS